MPGAKRQLGQAQHALNQSSSSSSRSGSGRSGRSHPPPQCLQPPFGGDANVDPPGSPHSSHSSRPPSPLPSSSRPASPARDPALERPTVSPRTFEIGGNEFSAIRGNDLSGRFPPRPANPSSIGKPQKMGLNTFHVQSFPTKKVCQFRILIGSGAEKPIVVRKVWESRALKEAIGRGWIFDGKDLAWRAEPIEREIRLSVDLDAEDGRQGGRQSNVFRVYIQQTNVVRFDTLSAYLRDTADFDNSCLEAINCMDHILREYPSNQLVALKRSFFIKGQGRTDLGSGVEASKGVYQSLRIAHGAGTGLSVNVDVANGMFWISTQLWRLAIMLTGARDVNSLIQAMGTRAREDMVKKMRRMRVICRHRGRDVVDNYTIDGFIFQSARDYQIKVKDANTNAVTPVSLYQYYITKYNIRLQHPDLPLIRMTKGQNTVIPMELLEAKENQRYPFKLDERQTAAMIKFAVEPPALRWRAIESGLNSLNWREDPVLRHFGLQIDRNKTVVNSRLLQAPMDLKGKKFLKPNEHALRSWAVCVIQGRRGGKPDRTVVTNFISQFVNIYIQHGGRVEQRQPTMVLQSSDDPGAAVTAAWNAAGNQANSRPQILVFILPDKDSKVYGRIKRSAECRYGVVSQCMQYAHVMKGQAQYISNVCMKFNAKLGGITARAVGPKTGGPTGIFSTPTVIIGADVSHAAPGSQAASMAAMTMSQDRLATRYSVEVETNGYRTEMITTENLEKLFRAPLQNWIAVNGGGKAPQRIIYLRDGVSEGQYEHVLQQEVADMKKLVSSIDPKNNTQFVVLVGTKRHHVRFFPEPSGGDRNGNCFPGTLVETGVTHPKMNDFYLCPHVAIKGTARPVHYILLRDDAKMHQDEIYTLLYEHSYQFIRATTPVSQHPAVYYAHIASNRAVPHDPKWGESTEDTPSKAAAGGQRVGSAPSSGAPVEISKLMPMPNQGGINSAMWYI
ncbi:Piwi-domain-containing protein [Polychaeton citri CBS 116435]|uniref:Piwi-domain-containing protein n=1 Tax=Polychaeton citri CBS 116435 TaxID=1314669 RepID=A0A9P4UKR8_9PEZI|nr:Piwi-domain-containing protein [Polychaeton citri CBS 116435]